MDSKEVGMSGRKADLELKRHVNRTQTRRTSVLHDQNIFGSPAGEQREPGAGSI